MTDNSNPTDVGQEQRTNPQGVEKDTEDFNKDIADQTPQRVHEQHLEADSGAEDKQVGNMLPNLTDDQLSRLSILEPGTPLEQGSVYLNLNDRKKGPFKALGGQEVDRNDKLIAKNMTDYELWNEIAGRDDTADIVRPN